MQATDFKEVHLNETTFIPDELKALPQWLVWRFEGKANAKGKLPKIPYYANGKRRAGVQGSEADRAGLTTFDKAIDAVSYSNPNYMGSGFAFLPGDGLIGIDIDNCFDPETGELNEIASHVLALVPDSFTELSPSRKGLHIIAKCAEGETFKDNGKGLEVFAGRQFFTVTGQVFGTPKGLATISQAQLIDLRTLVKGNETERAPVVAIRGNSGLGSNYGTGALNHACRKVAGAPEGARNDTLNTEAMGIAQLVAGGEVAESVARVALEEAGRACGLGQAEIKATLNSAFKAGKKQPRTAPETRHKGRKPAPADNHTGLGEEAAQPPANTATGKVYQARFPMIQTSGTVTYRVDENGVYFIGEDREGNELSPRWICSTLLVLAKTRDAKSGNWGRLLEWQDDDGFNHRWAMPLELLEGDSVEMRRELARQGLTIASGKGAGDLLASYIKIWKVENRAKCVDKLGWHGPVYVLPEKAIGSAQEEVVFQNANAVEPALSVSGTLEDWRANVAPLVSGNSRLIFGVAAAFAGPLVYLANEDSGGFHMRGPSSTGKSTALRVGASVWGDPAQYMRVWRTTVNGLEGLAILHNDNTLFLDELGQGNPKDAGEAVYMLGNGQGKTRANKHGAAREAATWRAMCVSSGEISLTSMAERAGIRLNAGQIIRLADMDADAGVGLGVFDTQHGYHSAAALALALKDGTTRFFGAAGMAWLEWIVSRRSAMPDLLSERMAAFVQDVIPANACGQVYRVAKRFALVAVAGDLATEAGITGWQPGEAVSGVASCFASWLENFGGGGKSEDRSMLSQVRAFFEMHGASRFEDVLATSEQRVPNRAGFFRTDDNGVKTFYVLPEAFRREVCEGFDAKAVARLLAEKGWIDCESNRQTQKPRLPGMGATRCYVVNGRMWESEE